MTRARQLPKLWVATMHTQQVTRISALLLAASLFTVTTIVVAQTQRTEAVIVTGTLIHGMAAVDRKSVV